MKICLCNLASCSVAVMVKVCPECAQVGGVPAVLKYLLSKGLLHGDCLTVTGTPCYHSHRYMHMLTEFSCLFGRLVYSSHTILNHRCIKTASMCCDCDYKYYHGYIVCEVCAWQLCHCYMYHVVSQQCIAARAFMYIV